jgi:hypothetical protein
MKIPLSCLLPNAYQIHRIYKVKRKLLLFSQLLPRQQARKGGRFSFPPKLTFFPFSPRKEIQISTAIIQITTNRVRFSVVFCYGLLLTLFENVHTPKILVPGNETHFLETQQRVIATAGM